MASRNHRWPAGDTPLTKAHGGTAAAALRAIKEARMAAKVAAARLSKPSPPRKDRRRPSVADTTVLEFIARVQGFRCLLCGGQLEFFGHRLCDDPRRPSIDHVTPRSLGGGNIGNKLVAHRQCNSDKSNRRATGCELVWLAAVNAALGIDHPHQGLEGSR